MKVCFYTLGCKVNQYETQLMKEEFVRAGFQIAEPESTCDVFVVNSCTVTGTGDKKTRNMLNRFRRMNPDGICVLTGCFPQAFPEQAVALGIADVITGTSNKANIVKHVLTCLQSGTPIVDIASHHKDEKIDIASISNFSERTRAFLKIQDGCDNRCTYCIIPKARGFVRSKTPEAIIEEAKALADAGYKEIVLVGINLCFYGRDLGLTFSDAIRAACSVDGIERVRLGSLEPELISDEDLKIMASLPKLCPSFHLALQSGSDNTLRKMARRYDTAFYTDLVNRIRNHFPDAAFTTDIMVGFPEETDEDFEESLHYMEKIGFSHAHVFTYSIRPGTPAASFRQVPANIKSIRTGRMLETCAHLQEKFLDNYIGSVCEVLVEAKHEDHYQGFTPNYCSVSFPSDNELQGTIQHIKITGRKNDVLLGIPISQS